MVTSRTTRVADSGFLSLRLQSPHQLWARATSSPAFTPMALQPPMACRRDHSASMSGPKAIARSGALDKGADQNTTAALGDTGPPSTYAVHISRRRRWTAIVVHGDPRRASARVRRADAPQGLGFMEPRTHWRYSPSVNRSTLQAQRARTAQSSQTQSRPYSVVTTRVAVSVGTAGHRIIENAYGARADHATRLRHRRLEGSPRSH